MQTKHDILYEYQNPTRGDGAWPSGMRKTALQNYSNSHGRDRSV